MEDSQEKQSSDQTTDNAANDPTILHTLIAVDAGNPRAAAEALFAWIQQHAQSGESDPSASETDPPSTDLVE